MISITYLVASFNAFLAIVMLISNWKLNKHILSFSLYLLVISFTSVLYDTIINGGSAQLLMLLVGYSGPLFFLVGPLFYFFIRGLVNEHHEFTDKDLIHLVPFFLNLIVMMPYLFKPVEFKLDMAERSLQNLSFYMNSKLVFLPVWFNTLIRIASMMFYILWSIVVLHRAYRGKIKVLEGALRKHYVSNYRWLNLISIASLLLVFMHLGLTMYFRFDPEMDFISRMENDNLFLVSVIINSIFPLIILFNPGILFGFPTSQVLNPMMKELLVNAEGKYSYSVLEAADKAKTYNDYFDGLSKRLLQYVEETQPYLDHDFNAEKLSDKLEVPLHHIHFCVKYYYGSTCKQMIALMRYKHAMNLIGKSAKKDNETIRNLVYDSGFDHFGHFKRVFRKNEKQKFDQWLKENT